MTLDDRTDPRSEWRGLAAAAQKQIEMEQGFGFDRLPFSADRVEQLRAKHGAARAVAATADREAKAAALAKLQTELSNCSGCDLGRSRTRLVFGAGSPDADLMFIGEAPGYHEDQQGVPFVGRAGELLTKIIEAIGFARDQVYIGNVLKCRPPGNRNPAPDETMACLPFLLRQIEIIQPRIIVTMGNPATQSLLQTKQGITKLRGRFTEWHGIEVMPTFHPAYLLRNPAVKRTVWEDMQKVWGRMRELGLPVGPLKGGRS